MSSSQKERREEYLNKLFESNRVLTPTNPSSQNSLSQQRSKMESDNSFDSVANDNDSTFLEANLTPLTYEQIEKDPKTPIYRAQFASRNRESSPRSFSPAPTRTGSGSNSSSSIMPSKNNISLRKHVLSKIKPGHTNLKLSSEALEASTPLEHESQKSTSEDLEPASILKKQDYSYDKELSKKIVKKIPRLSKALDANKQLNPVKGAKVVFSPHKTEYSPISFIASSPLRKSIRYSSPLTDSLKGVSSKNSYQSRREKLEKQGNEWIDDNKNTDGVESRDTTNKKSKKLRQAPSMFSFSFKSLVDPQLPYILSLYLQLLFNVVIVSILLYFVYSFISTVKADVDNKVESYSADISQEIAMCSREYIRNNCEPGKRVVAAEASCAEWERCMKRDPRTIGRAKVGAETFAEIINGFIKPISWKSMTFLFLITVGSLVLTNAAFGTYRNYSQYDSTFNERAEASKQDNSTPHTPFRTPYQSLPYNPAYSRYYTPRVSTSPTTSIVRHRLRSSNKKIKG